MSHLTYGSTLGLNLDSLRVGLRGVSLMLVLGAAAGSRFR